MEANLLVFLTRSSLKDSINPQLQQSCSLIVHSEDDGAHLLNNCLCVCDRKRTVKFGYLVD